MSEGLIALALLVLSQVFAWHIIRVDQRAEDEYRRWYEHPDRVWNQWRA